MQLKEFDLLQSFSIPSDTKITWNPNDTLFLSNKHGRLFVMTDDELNHKYLKFISYGSPGVQLGQKSIIYHNDCETVLRIVVGDAQEEINHFLEALIELGFGNFYKYVNFSNT